MLGADRPVALAQPDPRNPHEEQISYDVCDAMLAKNAANLADLRAEAASQEAAKAALKAGLTCLVSENCIQPSDGSPACKERAGFTGYTCQLKEGNNPDGVYTADGTQTSCVNIQYYDDPDDPSDDDDYYSQDPCETEAAKQEALAAAAKT